VGWVSFSHKEVSWLVLLFGNWHELGEVVWLGTSLGKVDVVTVNNDVLSEIGFAWKTNLMWWGWLVN
jgi:hypothetical protein